ncbi:hypothetical protein ACMU_05810 [Actibacterium mucosum KCTC 23349]|uniref:5-bromo-4-chloroindolyl phosphate hydrolysis protein n=1 Tax=Actibacterium mucosum KCTC 23349 TaxID=1454373 RepID=A0A037ZK40_9RHOB|nr:5-bromo-4-chloroindolyl phosphate hydrolysis family protein [Actibacterium mucosum]KAJ56458.1 hypothetical protein ACMU_05810 [Actibacterium mucosum KCTC 23349]
MAQRYGGQFSPDGKPDDSRPEVQAPTAKNPFHGAKPTRVGGRVNFLFVAPLPLAFRAFFSEPVVMAQFLAALALMLFAAWMTREGLKAEDAYNARTIAKRPAMPRKIFGSVLTGLGLGLAGLAGHGPIEAAIFAAVGAGLHLFSFGLDPMRDKGAEGIDQFQQDRVARVVDEAEATLDAMSDAILRAGDRGLMKRVEQFQATVRDMVRTVEEDPRDLTAARKYLGVYLQGARDATVKFADIYARSRDAGARADYEALLGDLEENFALRTRKLLLDNKVDLDVEIEVLRERLQRDGTR